MLIRRLVYSGSFFSLGSTGFGHSHTSMPRTSYCSQLGEIQPFSVPASCISQSNNRFFIFQGFSIPRVEKLFSTVEEFLSCNVQPASSWLALLEGLSSLTPCARRSFKDAISAAETSSSSGLLGHLDSHSVGLSLPSGPGMVLGSRSPRTRHFAGPSQTTPRLLVRRFRRGLGSSPVGLDRF